MRKLAIINAENTNVAALRAKAGPVPTTAIRLPTIAEARICTSRPVDQLTELAASRWSSVVSTGITAWTVGLKNVFPAAMPAATRYACQAPCGQSSDIA